MSSWRSSFTIFATCSMSIGNRDVFLPDTITLVLCSPPGAHTALIDNNLVGKNKSSMNFLSDASDSTSQSLPENSPDNSLYRVRLFLVASMSCFDKYSTWFNPTCLQEFIVNLSISELVLASLASLMDASTSDLVSCPVSSLDSHCGHSTAFFASKTQIGTCNVSSHCEAKINL